jgi:hypothetical protein
MVSITNTLHHVFVLKYKHFYHENHYLFVLCQKHEPHCARHFRPENAGHEWNRGVEMDKRVHG